MTELAIQALNLCKDFGHVKAVQSLNLEIPRSRIYGFLGPNGSGKTTAIRMLCGLLTPTSGEIDVLGYSIPDEAEALRVKVGYMTQKFSLFEDLTVAENLQFMADIYTLERKLKKQRIELAMERYHLSSFSSRGPARSVVAKNNAWHWLPAHYTNRNCYSWMNQPQR